MHQVCLHVLLPEEAHLFAHALVYSRHAQRRTEKLARVGAIDVSHAHNHEVQALDLSQVLLAFELPLCQIRPGFRLVSLLVGYVLWLVDHAGTKFNEAFYFALCSLAANVHGKAIGAEFVDLFLLREACFATAVEYIVELAATFTIEYPRQGSWKEKSVSNCLVVSRL